LVEGLSDVMVSWYLVVMPRRIGAILWFVIIFISQNQNSMLPKSILLAFCLLLFGENIYAQNLFFKFTDGTSATYTTEEIRKFTFSGNEMVLLKKDGTTVSWNASTIGNYRFDATTSITDAERINNAEVKIYPNPFKGAVRIRYELPVADKVAVDVLDMQGRIIRSWAQQQKSSGMHELLWQTNDNGGKAIPSGTYICRITTTKGSVSKMMMME
jgi:hypothetical protein